jgi:hypothetical protein
MRERGGSYTPEYMRNTQTSDDTHLYVVVNYEHMIGMSASCRRVTASCWPRDDAEVEYSQDRGMRPSRCISRRYCEKNEMMHQRNR